MSKIAVVTGASQGLGQALAKKLALDEFTVILVARTESKLNNVAGEIREKGGKALVMPTDISDAKAVDQLVRDVKEKFGAIDFLINNAGVFTTKLVEEMDIEDIKKDIDVSLFGAIICTRKFIPMIKSNGRILFIASAFGLMGAAGYSVYCASKAGIINFAESVRREVKSRKVSVHVATPGDIDTPAFREEEKNMPEWMGMVGARPTPLSADMAAQRILKKCSGKRFFIFSDFNIRSLYLMQKLVPKWLSVYILDLMFPKPNLKNLAEENI